MKSFFDRFFKDKDGRWGIVQLPNVLLWAWIILLIANIFIHNQHVATLQNATLFAWAYIELTQGSSYFRKTLGAAVLAGVIVNFFI